MSLIDQHEWAKAFLKKDGLLKKDRVPRIERMPGAWKFANKPVQARTFSDGAGNGWTVTAVETIRQASCPVRYVVITGAPSWAEYWLGTLCALGQDREMIVVNRPGFCGSGPEECITDIRIQAAALAPLLEPTTEGQRVVLVGHSYGCAIATLMADQNPGKVSALVLTSGYFGEFGITARRLVTMGQKVLKMIPRDLRHAIMEVTGQEPQLVHMKEALARLHAPVHVIHGDKDDYAPIEAARRLVDSVRTRRPVRFQVVAGGNHFLHGGPPYLLPALLEQCVPEEKKRFEWMRVQLPRFTLDGGRPEEAIA